MSIVHLDVEGVDADPLVQLGRWLSEAFAEGIPNADAAALATSSADGRPSVRFVLVKTIDSRGVVFYTNTESRKARELAETAHAALAFYWRELGRQARLTGAVEPVPREEAESYFRTRPIASRIGAWASPQSRPIGTRAELDRLYDEAAKRLGDDPPLPPHWGGYRLGPAEVELWEHRESRLHDRVQYLRASDGSWRRGRLAP